MPRDAGEPARRPYDNTSRQERAAETRQRIIAAGCEVVRQSHIRDWGGLTVSSVAVRAAVSERTVYRHFASELALRSSVMHAMEQRAGVDLATLRLDEVPAAAARIHEQVAAFQPPARAALDPMLRATHTRQRDALVAAVADAAPERSAQERTAAAAMLDVLWSVAAYERLRNDWGLDPAAATRAITWAIGLVETAVRAPLAITTDPK
jgi:AcrR family transcriptional regulator